MLKLLRLQSDERLLIPDIGTRLDQPYIPDSVHITVTDLSPAMLRQARDKANRVNAGVLGFLNESFDAVLPSLILSASQIVQRHLRKRGSCCVPVVA